MTETTRKRRAPGPFRYLVGAFASILMLVALHLHPVWRPWTAGVITPAFANVVWAFDVSLALQLVGNGVLAVWRPRWLRRLFELVYTLAAALVIATLYQVFPFDFAWLGPGVELVARLILGLAIFAVAIAAVVNLVLFLFWPVGRD